MNCYSINGIRKQEPRLVSGYEASFHTASLTTYEFSFCDCQTGSISWYSQKSVRGGRPEPMNMRLVVKLWGSLKIREIWQACKCSITYIIMHNMDLLKMIAAYKFYSRQVSCNSSHMHVWHTVHTHFEPQKFCQRQAKECRKAFCHTCYYKLLAHERKHISKLLLATDQQMWQPSLWWSRMLISPTYIYYMHTCIYCEIVMTTRSQQKVPNDNNRAKETTGACTHGVHGKYSPSRLWPCHCLD